jgi:hypothetical protein
VSVGEKLLPIPLCVVCKQGSADLRKRDPTVAIRQLLRKKISPFCCLTCIFLTICSVIYDLENYRKFYLLCINSLCVRVRFECIGAFRFK